MKTSTERPAYGYSLVLLLMWTVTSFLCHYSGKWFLDLQGEVKTISIPDVWREVFDAGILTGVQIFLCFLFVQVDSTATGSLSAAQMTHVLATFATNISMAMIFSSSTFAIKLMEPITSSIVQYFLLGTRLTLTTVFSLPIIVCGALAFSGNPLSESQLSLGVIAALVSNIILAFRNVQLKGSSGDQVTSVTLRNPTFKRCLFLLMSIPCLCFMLSLGKMDITTFFNLVICFISGIFHVLYSIVSTGLVLPMMSVVSHAVANIMKRVMVVLLLYMFGRRVATAENFLGLGICTVGLSIYAWDKKKIHSGTDAINLGTTEKPVRFKLHYLRNLIVISLILVPSSLLLKDSVVLSYESFGKLSEAAVRKPYGEGVVSFGQTFNADAHKKPELENLEPDLSGYLNDQADEINRFLAIEDHSGNPGNIGFLSKKLRTAKEIIKESQRLHFKLFGSQLSKYKYAVLFDMAAFENKGDSCISTGEAYLTSRINLKVIYYCESSSCTDVNLEKARSLVSKYTADELVILIHGGGNMVGYPFNDFLRFKFFKDFAGYNFFMFPMSMWIKDFQDPHLQECAKHYCCNENVTFTFRDMDSFKIANKYFKGTTKLLMAPDMAFQYGPVNRFISPVFDILWLKRTDEERPVYDGFPSYPAGIRVHVIDWYYWETHPAASHLEKAISICTNGMYCLLRGRVVVTERLHGHILAILLNIPHVLLDSKYRKLSSYHQTWTKSLENVRITDNVTKAMELALGLLEEYKDSIPPRAPLMNISEYFHHLKFDKPDSEYV